MPRKLFKDIVLKKMDNWTRRLMTSIQNHPRMMQIVNSI